jgi:hypothetical protein
MANNGKLFDFVKELFKTEKKILYEETLQKAGNAEHMQYYYVQFYFYK